MRHALLWFGWISVASSNHYAALGVNKRASSEEIKAAYRKKALECHPDKHGGDSVAFEKVNEAYETLSDPTKRRRYDMMEAYGYGQQQRGQSMPGGYARRGFDPRYGSFADFFEMRGSGGFYDGPNAFRRPPPPPPSRALRPFYVSLADLDTGTKVSFSLRDSPWSRLRDALADGFSGVAREGLLRTASLSASVLWRFPRLCFRRHLWWIRLPVMVIAFGLSLASQLPSSPSGRYEFDVRPGWKSGTKVVFKPGHGSVKIDNPLGARAVAFELRERRHPRISRLTTHAAGSSGSPAGAASSDLVWRGTISYAQAVAGTSVTLADIHGHEHQLELKLSREECLAIERGEASTVRRLVGSGLGLPRKKRKDDAEAQAERGELWAELALLRPPEARPVDEPRRGKGAPARR